MNTKFTPGPWRHSPAQKGTIFGNEVRSKDGLVCQMQHHPSRQGQAVVDSHLIAAAPEMYEAIVLAEGIILANFDPSDKHYEAYDAIVKALAKARGETT